jgi:hypothetical protein
MLFNLSAGDNTSEEVEAMLIELKGEINTLMTDLKSDVESMITELNSDVSSAVATLSTRGAVKSVQRGVQASKNTVSTITINPVNPDKCLVLLDSDYIGNSGTFNLPSLVSLTSTELTVSSVGINNSVGVSGGNFSWQVIEFY